MDRSLSRPSSTRSQGSIENKLWAHGLSQFSLWASIAHEEVVSSESEDKIGIWTSLVYSQALGYTPWAHYGQGVWAHLSFMLPVDAAGGPRGDKTRRLMLARAPIFALAIKFSHDLEQITGGEGFSTCYANGDVELQRFNPYIEVNPCSPSLSWRKRAFFQPNAIGEVGATKRELERLAAPSTPTKTGGFSPEFARHRLVSNTYAVKVQEAGSSIPFALENEYPKYPGYIMEEHLAPSTMFLDIDKMIGKYKQEWITNPESEVLPSLSRPKTSHLTTYDQNSFEKEWIGWGNQMFRNVILTVFPEFALTCIDSDVPTIPSVLKGLLPTPGGEPPAAPVTRPVDLRGNDVESFEDLMKTLDQTTDDVPGVDAYPAASMEVGGSAGSGGLPTKEDLPHLHRPGTRGSPSRDTPSHPDSQETFQTLEAW